MNAWLWLCNTRPAFVDHLRVQAAWLDTTDLLVSALPALTHDNVLGTTELCVAPDLLGTAYVSNPIDTTSHQPTPPPHTQTLPAREVYAQVQTKVRSLLNGVHTQEQVSEIRNVALGMCSL